MLTLGIDATEVFLARLKGRPIGDNGHYKRALLFFLCKALKTSRAIASLQQSGFPEDAQILARTVYELRLQALYLADDPKIRVPQFRVHEQKSQMKGLRRFLASGNVQGHPKKVNVRGLREGDWWGPGGLRQIAKHLGMESDYDITYWLFSGYVHSSSRVLSRYWKQSKEGAELSHKPTKGDDLHVASKVTQWLLEILDCSADAVDLDYANELKAAATALVDLRRAKMIEGSNQLR